jgi:hypothetical protein
MSYDKITPESFIAKMDGGAYKTAGAARRAVGRSALTDEGKAKCYKAISAKFEGGTTTATPPATVPAPAPRSRSSKKKKKKKAAKKKVAKKAQATKAPRKQSAGRKLSKKKMFDSNEEQLSKIHLAKERVGTIVDAINAMRAAKEVNPELDTDKGAESAQKALTSILEDVHQSVIAPEDGGNNQGAPTGFAAAAGASIALPGQESPIVKPSS